MLKPCEQTFLLIFTFTSHQASVLRASTQVRKKFPKSISPTGKTETSRSAHLRSTTFTDYNTFVLEPDLHTGSAPFHTNQTTSDL